MNLTDGNECVESPNQSSESKVCDINESEVFKKPLLLVGPRRGKIVGKVRTVNPVNTTGDDVEPESDKVPTGHDETNLGECEKRSIDETETSCKLSPAERKPNYIEPKWAGYPNKLYCFEVLKSGKILEHIDLSSKSCYIIGRLSTCDVQLIHPTVSRFHAVLQFKSEESKGRPTGFYVYDLGSTHGTFLNKIRIKSNLYVKMHVGHMLTFGLSSRKFILEGPSEDMEEESELTVTQLKEQGKRMKAEALAKAAEKERRMEEQENRGIDWGMGEDADEETDLAENPFASTQNEELFISDPKKTLRGWFEREGYELEYDVEEKGFGQFLCKVELPIEAARGGSMMAEALVKGKKKESVVQCALEACRILDRYGLLRQANHESKKRKAKNWEDDDFYDSDEDTFLDRTGAVEKKRMQRMQAAGKVETQTETHDSLMKKHGEIVSELQKLESQLEKLSSKTKSSESTEGDEEDPLDAFMTNLSSEVPDTKLLGNLKKQIASLNQEESRLRKLINIARPANLPELAEPKELLPAPKLVVGAKTGPMKRKVRSLKPQFTGPSNHNLPKRKDEFDTVGDSAEEEEDDEQEEEKEGKNEGIENKDTDQKISLEVVSKSSNVCDVKNIEESTRPETSTSSSDDSKDQTPSLEKSNSQIKESFSTAPKPIGPALPPTGVTSEEPLQKRKKTNRHRRSHNTGKGDTGKKDSSDYDTSDPAYSMWVPPEDQSGDGRTKLNDKYGY